MCGFTGFTGNIVNRAEILRKMADRIIHRGPDMEGYHVSGEGEHDSIALGFRRLSIIDLADGAQPMYNEDKTVVSVFNGEIYNFMEIRHELIAKGHVFKTIQKLPPVLFSALRSRAFLSIPISSAR